MRSWLRGFCFANPEKVSEETVDVLSKCAQQFGAERAIFQWLSRRFDLELEKKLEDISQPVTLIWGEKAKYPPLDQAYRLQVIPGHCTLIVLENTGSLAPLESPERVTEILSGDLDSTIRIYKAG